MQRINNTKLKELWQQCLDILKDIYSKAEYDAWFSVIKPNKYEDNKLFLTLPSEYYVDYIDATYSKDLLSVIKRVFGQNSLLSYVVNITNSDSFTEPSYDYTLASNPQQQAPISINRSDNRKQLPNPFVIPGLKPIQIDSQLKPTYTFDNFIEGECNKFARCAGFAVSQNPGKTAFNPLLIYSKVGLGKTHLAHAIGLQTKKLHPNLTVLYISADQFLRQYLKSIENKTTNDFLQFYQMIDVLIVDDIQILEGKKSTQEIFFQIFNWLHNSGKQLIVTSDKSPADMIGFEERVLSRLKWGLNAELTSPDVKTKIAILEKKMEIEGGLQIPKDVIEYLAYSVGTSIRELEGAFVSIIAHATLSKVDINLDLARDIIDKFIKSNKREITIDFIQKVVCNYYNLSVEQMISSSRKSNIVTARHVSMFLARKYTKASLENIGLKCGNKDHTTVMHACKIIESNYKKNKDFAKAISTIERQISD